MNIIDDRQLYTTILKFIDKDMGEKGIKPIDLLDKSNDYVISRSQYYNIKKIADGVSNKNHLSRKRLTSLCEYLGIPIINFLYHTKIAS